jgi:hypothetical protein
MANREENVAKQPIIHSTELVIDFGGGDHP